MKKVIILGAIAFASMALTTLAAREPCEQDIECAQCIAGNGSVTLDAACIRVVGAVELGAGYCGVKVGGSPSWTTEVKNCSPQ